MQKYLEVANWHRIFDLSMRVSWVDKFLKMLPNVLKILLENINIYYLVAN